MVNAVKQLSGGGVHHAFEVVGHTGLLADAINMTRAGGNVCAVGVPDLTATVTYNFQSLHQNKNLMGSVPEAPSHARTSARSPICT